MFLKQIKQFIDQMSLSFLPNIMGFVCSDNGLRLLAYIPRGVFKKKKKKYKKILKMCFEILTKANVL